MVNGNETSLGENIEERQRELEDILRKHRQWLESDKREGERADFSSKDLRELSFRCADLRRAVFGNAQVFDADLYGASLREVDLTQVEGLAECQLAGTDLSRAKLPCEPHGIGTFASLDQIKDISIQARTLLWVTIMACVFTIFTMSMTSDSAILSHSGSTLLPVVEINVPIGVFFWFMPVVLLGLYLYLHFQLQYLWNGLAGLPSFFPDGTSLDERAYPLFLRSLVRLHVPLLRPPAQWWLQVCASITVAWGLVPFTMFLFWVRYLRLHELRATIWHIALLALVMCFGLETYRLAVDTLAGKRNSWQCGSGHRFREETRSSRSSRDALIFPAMVMIIGLLVSFAALYVEDLRSWFYSGSKAAKLAHEGKSASEAVPEGSHECRSWKWLSQQVFADFSFGEISHKPGNWLTLGEEERRNLLGVKGALLSLVNLQGADGHGAFLVDATLDGADLQGADFSGADLRKAALTGAKLQRADLRNADLRGAHLDHCCLKDAKLKSARLSKLLIPDISGSGTCCSATSFFCADLEGADLYGADLAGANLESSILQGAKLGTANLHGANLKNANLRDAVLLEANLRNVDFTGATLHGVDFGCAALQGANFNGADLSSAKNLTNEQIREALFDQHTKLPSLAVASTGKCPKNDKPNEQMPSCRPCR